MTDNDGNTTKMKYDTLGRKKTMIDPDMGTWVYDYDLNGNLWHQTDAKGQTITFEYDAGNRVTSKTYSPVSADNPPVNYAYDNPTIPNGIGRPYSVSNTKATTVYNSYDALGKVLSSTKTIEGNPTPYTTAATYDLAGRPETTTYPGTPALEVTNAYHPGTGLLHTVTDNNNIVYATMTGYTPSGKIGTISHQNGTTTTYTYNPLSTRLMVIRTLSPTSILADPSTHIINRAYVYSHAGNINSITDKKKGRELSLPNDAFVYSYSYDRLHRFTNESTTNNTYNPVAYIYNAIGNIMTKTSGGTAFSYTYDPVKKHAVTSIQINGGNTYSFGYDQNGNMISGYDLTDLQNISARTITYNADNMPVQVSHARFGTTNITYDGTSNRVKKISPSGSTTYYIGEHFEVKDTQQVKYIFAGNLRVAKVSNTDGTVYFHKDHLGSSAAMTSTSGAILEETNYMPFGEIREHTGLELSNYKFTDQEFDPETGLYYYGARYYDPIIGRFISPDSVVPDPYDPQTLNRYSYCRNNPIIYTDPSGHTPWHVVALVIAAVSATTAAIQTGSQGNWDLLDMAGSAGMAFITTFVSAAVGSGASSVIGSTVAGGAIGGAFGGSWSSLAYGGNVAEGALYGAIGGAIGGATGGIDIGGVGVGVGDVAFRIAAAGITSGIIAELSGAKFSQGAIPAMLSAAAVSIAAIASKGSAEKGVVTDEKSEAEAMYEFMVDQMKNHTTESIPSDATLLAENDFNPYKGTGLRPASEGDPIQKILPKNYKTDGINNLPGQKIPASSSTPAIMRVLDVIFKILKGLSNSMLIIVPNPKLYDHILYPDCAVSEA